MTVWLGAPPAIRKRIFQSDLPIDKVEATQDYNSKGAEVFTFVEEGGAANLITSFNGLGDSKTTAGAKGGPHYPVIDMDVPCYVLPSSTPGHSHLYIDKLVTATYYEELLRILFWAGLVEEGYYKFFMNNGYTAVRPPGVVKRGVSTGAATLMKQNADLQRENRILRAELEYYKGISTKVEVSVS